MVVPTLTYLHDDAGRPTFVQRNGSPLAEATYDAAGRLATIARTNPGNVAGSTTTYAYDGADRVTGLTTVQGVATLGDFQYAYARSGRVAQATEAIGGTTRTVGYTYDGLGRVAGSTVAFGAGGTTTYAYGYDNVGNRTGVSVNGTPTQSRSYDAADQVVGWTYDGAGNLTNDGGQTYTWDPLGRLLGVTRGGVSPAYSYTGDGHLLSEASGTATTRSVLDTEGGLVERLGAVTTTGSATTSARYSRGLGGELSREAGGSAAQTWYLADRPGSVRAEYGSAAASSLRVDYDPFGQPEAGTGLGSPTDYGFAGESRDSGTGLVQLRARWYQPASGALLGRDPFAGDPAAPQTLNPYAYAHNDPVNLTDPTGHVAVALAALTAPGGIVSPLSLVAADAAGAVTAGGQAPAGALCAEGPGRTATPNLPLPSVAAPALVAVPDPGVCHQCAGWAEVLKWWG